MAKVRARSSDYSSATPAPTCSSVPLPPATLAAALGEANLPKKRRTQPHHLPAHPAQQISSRSWQISDHLPTKPSSQSLAQRFSFLLGGFAPARAGDLNRSRGQSHRFPHAKGNLNPALFRIDLKSACLSKMNLDTCNIANTKDISLDAHQCPSFLPECSMVGRPPAGKCFVLRPP